MLVITSRRVRNAGNIFKYIIIFPNKSDLLVFNAASTDQKSGTILGATLSRSDLKAQKFTVKKYKNPQADWCFLFLFPSNFKVLRLAILTNYITVYIYLKFIIEKQL